MAEGVALKINGRAWRFTPEAVAVLQEVNCRPWLMAVASKAPGAHETIETTVNGSKPLSLRRRGAVVVVSVAASG